MTDNVVEIIEKSLKCIGDRRYKVMLKELIRLAKIWQMNELTDTAYWKAKAERLQAELEGLKNAKGNNY